MIDGDAGEVMEMHGDDYLDMEEEFEPVEGCNCIYCRMARMEKKMRELNRSLNLIVDKLQLDEEKKVKNEP